MVGICLACHGKMADGMKDSINLIIGEMPQFTSIGLFEGNSIEDFTNTIYEKIISVNTGDGVIVFVDLANASPFNATSKNITRLRKENIPIRLISGVNLPMLLETLVQRDIIKDINELYKLSLKIGKDDIKELIEELENQGLK